MLTQARLCAFNGTPERCPRPAQVLRAGSGNQGPSYRRATSSFVQAIKIAPQFRAVVENEPICNVHGAWSAKPNRVPFVLREDVLAGPSASASVAGKRGTKTAAAKQPATAAATAPATATQVAISPSLWPRMRIPFGGISDRTRGDRVIQSGLEDKLSNMITNDLMYVS